MASYGLKSKEINELKARKSKTLFFIIIQEVKTNVFK